MCAGVVPPAFMVAMPLTVLAPLLRDQSISAAWIGCDSALGGGDNEVTRSEEHTSELQ